MVSAKRWPNTAGERTERLEEPESFATGTLPTNALCKCDSRTCCFNSYKDSADWVKAELLPNKLLTALKITKMKQWVLFFA